MIFRIGVIAAAIGVIACSPPPRVACDAKTFAQGPELCLSRTRLAFNTDTGGGTFIGTRPVDSVRITNRGLMSLTLSQVTRTGAPEFKWKGSWGDALPATITAGQSAFLEVEFAPREGRGYAGSITIESNGTNATSFVIELDGCGVPPNGGASSCLSCDVPSQSCAPGDAGVRTCYQSATGSNFCSFVMGTRTAGEVCERAEACVRGAVCLQRCDRLADGGCVTPTEPTCYQACSRDGGVSGCAAGKACLDLSSQGVNAHGACAL